MQASTMLCFLLPSAATGQRTAASTMKAARSRPCHRAWLLAALMVLAAPGTQAQAALAEGVWLIDEKAAVQIFDCSGLLCGRILWLQIPRDAAGQLNKDRNNPDPALRQRGLCGLTVLWGLRSTGPDRWGSGWFYNPDDGKTYQVSAELRSLNLIIARIYRGIPFLGETKTLRRISRGRSDGWC
jgi:uncharacterized protein (DUF2147 family)